MPLPPSTSTRRLACAVLSLSALALAGCSESSNPVMPPALPPLSRVVISLGADTLVTADTLNVGQQHMFSATVRDTGNAIVNTTVGWLSTNSAVFTVNASGAVVGRGEGGAWLIASAGDKKDSVAILVKPAITGWVVQTTSSARRLNGVFFQSDGANGVAVGDGGEVLTTSNAGNTWTRRTSNTSMNLYAVWFPTPSVGWAVGASGMMIVTTNGGMTWSTRPSGTFDNLMGVTFATPDTGWAVGSGGAILNTVDGGVSWTKTAPVATLLEAVSFSDTRHGWVVGDNGVILGTSDRGLTWTQVLPAVTTQALNGVWTRGTDLARAVGAAGVAPRTIDNGGTEEWELRNAGASFQLEDVVFPTDLRGFAVGQNGTGAVLRSDDGGATWTPQVAPVGTPLRDVFFVDAFRGWAVGDNGRILHTATGGD